MNSLGLKNKISLSIARLMRMSLLLLLLAVTVSCGGDSTDTRRPEENLWEVVSYFNGQALVSPLSGTQLTLQLSLDEQASGSAGCNTFNSSATLDGNSITFGPIATTRMICDQPDGVMDQESAYLAALQGTAGYAITGNQMEFTDENQNVQVRFETKDDF